MKMTMTDKLPQHLQNLAHPPYRVYGVGEPTDADKRRNEDFRRLAAQAINKGRKSRRFRLAYMPTPGMETK